MKNKYIIHTILAVVAFTYSACEDFVTVENPPTELISSEVFQDDYTATSAMASVYTKMSSESGGLTSITYLGALSADDCILYSSDQSTRQVYTNNIIPSNNLMTNFWGGSGYSLIYQLNAIIEGLQGESKITPSLKDQLLGEAHFLRAFFHFYLVNQFGDIPYITSTDYISNTSAQKMVANNVLEKVIEDLKYAQDRLSVDYSFSNSERIKPTKWAASAMLARVHLYQGNWNLAEQESSSVIDNVNMFSLTSLNDVFLKNSNEAIWQLKPTSVNRNTNEGSIFILTSTPRFSALTINLINSFPSGDLRKSNWTASIKVGANTYYYPYKYKIRTGSSPLNEYSMVLRLAEQYLIRSEARCQQNKLTSAIEDIDQIRQRAGLLLVSDTNPSITKDELQSEILKERRFELFTEWGHRWFDLKRTGSADMVLGAVKPGWSSTDVLYPIPAKEVLINPNMSQNPGY